MTHHKRTRRRIRSTTRTLRDLARLARELAHFLMWATAAAVIIAATSSSGGPGALLSVLELIGSIRR